MPTVQGGSLQTLPRCHTDIDEDRPIYTLTNIKQDLQQCQGNILSRRETIYTYLRIYSIYTDMGRGSTEENITFEMASESSVPLSQHSPLNNDT